jgi:hypothetical protein
VKFLIEIKTKKEKDSTILKDWWVNIVKKLKDTKTDFMIDDDFIRTSGGYQIHVDVIYGKAIEDILKFLESKSISATPCFSSEYKALDCEQLPQKASQSSCALKPKQPGNVRRVEEQEFIEITEEMVEDYRNDFLEIGTYANEAEALVMGELLGIDFYICDLITDTDLLILLQVGGPSGNFLLHRYNHYVVLTLDDGGPYKLKVPGLDGEKILSFSESKVKTRVDGSCLLDGGHIIKYGKNAEEEDIIRYRKYLSRALPEEMIRQTLTTIMIDVSRGLEVSGLGPRISQCCQNVPRNFLTSPKLMGTDHTLICAVGSHALIKEASQHKGPIFISIPSEKKGKQKGKKKGNSKFEPIQADELLKNFCGQSEGMKLKLVDGQLDQLGGYILFVNCECKKCVGTVVEIWIMEESDFIIPPEEEFRALFGTEFTFTNQFINEAPQIIVKKIKKENEVLEKSGGKLKDVPSPDALVKTDLNEIAQKQWAEKIVKLKVGIGTPEVVMMGEYSSQRIYYPDNWWYQVSLDVSCIELQTCPMTLDYAKKHKETLQKDIFDLAKSLGIKPDELAGGGHIHIGIRHSFRNNPFLFHNFFIDLCNHPFLLELLENDPINAPVIAQYPIEKQKKFQQSLDAFSIEVSKAFKEKKISWNYADDNLILGFVNMVRSSIYKNSFRQDGTGMPAKYQALNLERVREIIPQQDWTIEIRSVRAQRSMEEFILVAKLIEARINFLAKKLKNEFNSSYGLIKFVPQVRSLDASKKDTIAAEIKKFVTEAGLNPADYLKLLDQNYPERDIKWSKQPIAKVS